MDPSVRSGWRAFNERFEGAVNHMYLDIKGLVTTGVGNLIDPMPAALALPWLYHLDGSPATQDYIAAEWRAIKSETWLAKAGAGHVGSLATLYLTDQAITDLVLSKLDEFEAGLRKWPAFWSLDSWPAPAQTAILSMAWAQGPSFGPGWPHFSAACARQDWAAAADNCRMDDRHNAGLVPRNDENQRLFRLAAEG